MEAGIFTISLDFEIYWGVRDQQTLSQYQENLANVQQATEQILQLFTRYDVHATWATVGFLFFANQQALQEHLPKQLPHYSNTHLSPYVYLQNTEQLEPRYHFAPALIKQIQSRPGQEIGTHTFSHYYCLENGQTKEAFKHDLEAAIAIAHAWGIDTKSLVFPRNQWNPNYLSVLNELGISSYRGNEKSWIYEAKNDDEHSYLQRAFRLLDAYFNLSGHHTYALEDYLTDKPFNLPSSRFLRPYSNKLKFLERQRLKRITNALDVAASKNQLFHLWWHPHNFGANMAENIHFLEQVLRHYRQLNKKTGMQSLNMGEVSMLAEGIHK